MTLTDVRAWAVREGLLVAGRRGPVSLDLQRAHARAHDLPEPQATAREAKAKRERPFAGAACSCGRRWEGLAECHCRRCHTHFRNSGAFDLHIVGVSGTEDTKCLPVEQVRYRQGAQKGEPKLKVVNGHHGPLVARAGDRPEELNG